MKRWKICCGSLVLVAGLAPAAYAQLPAAAPAAAGVPAAAAGVPVAAAPAAPTANLWTFLCLPPEKKAACKAKLCNSPLGQMLNNSLRPASAMTGGLVPSLCPVVSAADLAKPADSPAGAAARIQQDEMEAKARREDVRILGLKDCHYWPEAQLALINALRADRNECVRLEAALALGNGCCCSKATITALTICVSGSEVDGNPSENSPRVRAAAEGALAHCLACYTEVVPVPPDTNKGIEQKLPTNGERQVPIAPPVGPAPLPTKTPDKLPNIGQVPVQPADFYKRVEMLPRQDVLAEGKRVADRGVTTPVKVEGQPAAAHSVTDIVRNAFNTGPASAPTMMASPVMVDKNVQPIPVVPVSSPAPPLAPISKATLPTTPAVTHVPVIQTSASAPISAYQVTTPVQAAQPAPDAPRRVPSYQTTTFVPKPPAVVPAVQTKTVPTPNLAPATSQPVLQQAGADKAQVIAVLQAGSRPEQRIWAAQTLGACDGWTNPDVMEALVKAARGDSHTAVRAACVRCLGRMSVNTLPVLTALQEMNGDRDLGVRAESEQALHQLTESGPLQVR